LHAHSVAVRLDTVKVSRTTGIGAGVVVIKAVVFNAVVVDVVGFVEDVASVTATVVLVVTSAALVDVVGLGVVVGAAVVGSGVVKGGLRHKMVQNLVVSYLQVLVATFFR
jgi:hypothetical protein